MKTDKRTQLLKILSDASQSISSAALANMLGTSERTVRNYIKAINEEGKAVITSSREGYRLESHTASLDTLPNEAESRVWKVLSDLLTSKEGVNAFDEAEALYVSSSTILNTVIPQVKEIAKEYDLRIESQKYQFYLRGSEQNRRKMIGSLAVRNTYGFFNSKDALEQLFPSQDIDGIMQELFTTCQESKLFLNDFALNNLLIHILVILIRLNIGNELDDKEPPISVDELLASSQDREDIVNLADMISANFEQKYSIRIPERDYKQILMLIALSVEHETVDIQCVISPEFIHNVASILSMMSQRYCTPEFDNDYILQFSLHMYYAQQRCAFHISYPNPIALQFKKDYAPVYDMAVYFAHRFAQIYHIEVSEDEIAFIAFHIGSYLENNKQSREHAEKTRQSIKKTLSTQIDLANRVQKFVDCRTKDASRRELYIVEGDSAMGAVKQSRDSEYQAIMPIRGKILNCLKADYARIFKSDIIVDLIKVMGCGVELGGKHNKELATFNLDNLRYNKIVICTDADVDGYQIRTLVLTMLYRLTPTLINEGYVYIAESPLYEITTKDRTYFAYTEPEKAAFLKEIGEKKYTIQRSKGLGENDPEMMWLTTMNPESRRLIKVLPTDVEETARVFDLLLGDNLAGRKEHIAEHGAEYLDDLDVS